WSRTNSRSRSHFADMPRLVRRIMMQSSFTRPRAWLGGALATLLLAACGGDTISDPPATPTLDAQLRQTISGWGVVPIGAVNPQPAALVDLGRSLFFDKILSGNRDVSCATCHDPLSHMGDGLSLSIGTGAVMLGGRRELGAG